ADIRLKSRIGKSTQDVSSGGSASRMFVLQRGQQHRIRLALAARGAQLRQRFEDGLLNVLILGVRNKADEDPDGASGRLAGKETKDGQRQVRTGATLNLGETALRSADDLQVLRAERTFEIRDGWHAAFLQGLEGTFADSEGAAAENA